MLECKVQAKYHSELNRKGIFSSDANISRLKTQLLHEANASLNILNIRRKLAEEMRHIPNERWFASLAPNDLISMMSSANRPSFDLEASIFHDKSHDQYVNQQISEIKHQMPILELDQVPKVNIIKHPINNVSKAVTMNTSVKTVLQSTRPAVVLQGLSTRPVGVSNASNLVVSPPAQLSTQSSCEVESVTLEESGSSSKLEETKHVIKRSDSMPDISDQSELGEELRSIKEMSIQRKQSVSQMLLHGYKNDNFKRCEQIVKEPVRDESATDRLKEDDFSPLLQYHGKQITRKKVTATKPLLNVCVNDEDDLESLDNGNGLTNIELPEQPKVLNVKVPGKGIVRISDVKISNEIEETKLTLHMHPTIYNEFLDEIDEETVKSLDKHLFAGEEITDVYDEITKTLSKDHLYFDKDDFVEPCAGSSIDTSSLFMSSMLMKNIKQSVGNTSLKKEWIPPWNEYTCANEWRNEPKFAGFGREDILKFDMKRGSLSNSRYSGIPSHGMDVSSVNKLMKSYNSWLSWYKTNLTTEDYRKFISTKENDFLSQIFHFYDSDTDEHDLEEERAKTSADLKKINERNKRKQELRMEKRKYEKGYWNSQSVLLGGLGNDPSITDLLDGDVENEKENDEAKVSSVMLQDRFNQIWTSLQMSDQERLSMAIKYSTLETIDILEEVVVYWESIADLITQREGYMKKLEHFERSASDPNRFFVKGPTGSSVARINEAKTRRKLNKKIKLLDEEIKPMLVLIQERYKDQVTYQGRIYLQKMQSDRIEMLYWLQQERRKQALEIQTNVVSSTTPVKRIELNPLS